MSSTPGNSSLIPVQPGERLAGRYVVERVVGTGGMGVVVAARHEQLGRTVAIKILTISTDLHPEAVERFLREARAAASLRSEHIARVMDVGTDEQGRHFIVMEYLEGEDLGAVVRGEPLSIGQAVGYVLQACEALAEAHNQGIIHRDLKPENMFLTRRVDGSPLIKVLDFGISKMTTPERNVPSLSVSGPRSLLGSPLYMSPEQIRTPSSIDPRSDVWALGVILFELLAGRRPFQGQSLPDILASILTHVPPGLLTLRPDAPPALANVVASCLNKDVNLRMGSVGLLAQALQQWAPRWARDSAARAARLSGILTQSTGSIDFNVQLLSETLPHHAEPPEQREQDHRDPGEAHLNHPGATVRKHGLAAGLLITGVACGLLAVGAWRLYHAPRFNMAAARLVPSPMTAPALAGTAGGLLPAPAPTLPPVTGEPLHPIDSNTPTTSTPFPEMVIPSPAIAAPPGEVGTATVLPVPAAVGGVAPSSDVVSTVRGSTVDAAPGTAKSAPSLRRHVSRRVKQSPNRHPSATTQGAVSLDPLEGRK